jgi:hypothetical protein
MRGLQTFLTLTLLTWTSACSLAPGVLLTPTPTLFVFPTVVVTPIPPLTAEQVKNAEYTITGFDNSSHTYLFVDGKYNHGTDSAAPDFVDIKLLDFLAFGDLNNDGATDAAVLIAENYGGTGVFVSVAAVLNENGQPQHVASTMVDDRPQINKLEIRNGEIFLDAVVHGVQDPGCCPTFAVTRTYKLIGPALVLVNATSQTPGGQSRIITIDQPHAGADASGALIISGKVTIAPFENTLSFRAYNDQGNELSSGPVMVTAPDLGAPGTFTVTLDLSAFPPGRLRIEIADLSAADGSVLALDSVEVVVR